MALEPFVPGGGTRSQVLEAIAMEETETPPVNFVGNTIFPDLKVDSFEGYAPISFDHTKEAADDDTAHPAADYPEISWHMSQHEYGLGFHARQFTINNFMKIKAEIQQRNSGGFNALFNLEDMGTRIITGQHLTHNEYLKMLALQDTTKYPESHVLPPLAIDTCTVDEFLGAMLTAARLVQRDGGKGPANTIIIGDGTTDGAILNANLRTLMPDNAPKVLSQEALIPLLKLPEGQASVRIATETIRMQKNADPVPMMDQGIWVGRAVPPNNKGDGFGANLWRPTLDSGERYFVYRRVHGQQRLVTASIEGFYQVHVNNYNLGVWIPTTVTP